MKAFVVLVAALIVTRSATADVNYNMAKDQAKRDASQNNAQQGVTPSAPPTPAAPQLPPTDPALIATFQNITDLRADLDALALATDAQAGAEQRISLLNHLATAAAGKKASSASVRKLAGHLIAAVSGKKNLAAQNAQLARDLHALFNGAHLSTAQQQNLLDGVKKILTDGGVSADDTDNVVADLKQIAIETQ